MGQAVRSKGGFFHNSIILEFEVENIKFKMKVLLLYLFLVFFYGNLLLWLNLE